MPSTVVHPAQPSAPHPEPVTATRSRAGMGGGAGARAGVVAVATAAVSLGTALWLPRGPIGTADALLTMVIGLAVGLGAGHLMRSRWAMLLAPTTFVVVYELSRMDLVGPSVDAPRFDVYGIIALVVGRGFHGVLVLVPMLLGVAVAAAASRRRGGHRPSPATRRARAGRAARRTATVLTALGLLLLAGAIARPASTAPITGPDGETVTGSVAELRTVEIGGAEQVVMIRGRSVDNPVLLFLAGGPGGTELGTMRLFNEDLEDDFVVATWDQRGTGKSRAALDPTEDYTLDRIVQDTVDLTNYLRERFDEEKVYLVGNSWGTTLGVLAVQDSPELFHAFVGTGQMVSQAATDRIFMADTLAWARERGDGQLEKDLLAWGTAPYDDVRAVTFVAPYEREWNDYDRVDRYAARGEMPGNLLVEEYSFMDVVSSAAGGLDTFSVVYPQLDDIDFRETATELAVPVYVVHGAHEARGRTEPAREWFEMLDAPVKEWTTFELSGHRPMFEEPDRFHEVMQGVLGDTY